MMKKMNKKLLGSLILGLMLSAPVSQVNAIQLNGGVFMGVGTAMRNIEPGIMGALSMTLAGIRN